MRSFVASSTLVDGVAIIIGAELLELVQFGREMLPPDKSAALEAALLGALADLVEELPSR